MPAVEGFRHNLQSRAARCDLAAQVLHEWGKLSVQVLGASMLPAIWPGDILSVDRAEAAELEPGELVVYAWDGIPVVHRVVENEAAGLITRGDSVDWNDPPVSPSQVMGRVVSIRRGGAEFAPKRMASRPQELLGFLVRRSPRFKGLLLKLYALLLRPERTSAAA